jgi:hypothetical protein
MYKDLWFKLCHEKSSNELFKQTKFSINGYLNFVCLNNILLQQKGDVRK